MKTIGFRSLDGWTAELSDFFEHSPAVAMGVLSSYGDLLASNRALNALLGADQTHPPTLEFLMNPPLDQLIEMSPYTGWFTFGRSIGPYHSLLGQTRRKGDEILIVAGYDVDALELTTQQALALNSEITNLQRELSTANGRLEQTLSDLREAQSQLIHSEKMNAIGQLTAGVAHEINNPVAFVKSNLHSLGKTIGDLTRAYQTLEASVESEGSETQRQMAQTLRRDADLDFVFEDMGDLLKSSMDGLTRVARIVEDLQTFSRLDESDFKRADLLENLQSCLALARPILRDRITVNVQLDGIPAINCYPAELNQVFMNLIINAAQAIEGSGTITIQGRDEARQVVLSFTDTGYGMTPEVLTKIFNPFFTTKPVGSGTGLGLAVSYKIITDRHHGTLTVQSTPGTGSTFTITLPKDLRP